MYTKIKRIMDVFFSIILLVIFSIPILIIATAIKIESKGPCIYKSKRIGKDLKPFYLYKFRTMKIERKELDNTLEYRDIITKVGSFLRKTSLDELPQFINVIKGEMSLIGPRPWIPQYYEYFTEEQKKRNNVLPGISGLAQVSGRNGIGILEKIYYDLEYVDNYCFKQDVEIFFRTINTVLSKKYSEITEKEIEKEIIELKKNRGI